MMKLHHKKKRGSSHKKKPQSVSPIEFDEEEEEESDDNKINNNKKKTLLSKEELTTASEEKSSKDANFIAFENNAKKGSPSSIDNQQQKQKMKHQQLPRYNNGTNSHQYHKGYHGQPPPLLIVPPDDAIDETSFGENDPYVYSDDSGSLSDAYFFPDHDSTNAVMTTFSSPDYNNNNNNNNNNKNGGEIDEERQQQQNYGSSTTVPSRITLNGILEDSPLQEVTPLLPTTNGGENGSSCKIHRYHHYSTTTSLPSNGRKQQLRQQRVQLIRRRKQRQQEREYAVKQIRGKPQLTTKCHDFIWLLLFVLQLVFVIACAIRYGWTLLRFNPSIYYSIHSSTTATTGEDNSIDGQMATRFLMTTTTTTSQPSSLSSSPASTSSFPSLRRRHQQHPNPLEDFPNHHNNLRNLVLIGGSTTTTSSSITNKNSTIHETSQQQHETPEELKDLEDDDNFEPVEIKQPSTISTASSSSSTSSSASTSTTTSAATKGTPTSNNIVQSNSQDQQTTSTSGVGVGANDKVNNAEVPFSTDYQILIKLFWISGLYAMIISCCSLGIMLIVSRALIPMMLVFSILLAVCWGVFGLAIDPSSMISILGFAFLIASLGYALACWNRIGFCSTNLYTAICSMRDTPSVLCVGFGSLWMAVLWCWIWSVAMMGILNTYNAVDCEDNQHCETHIPEWWKESDVLITELVILILNLYWTMMVIKNIVRVCVAGAIGAWWFASPRQPGRCCCDNTVWGPWSRACTISLGSVCLGSLLVLPAQTISVLGSVCCWMVGGGSHSRENNLLIVPPKTQQKNNNDSSNHRSRPDASSSSSATQPASSSEHPYENDEDSFQCLGFIDRLWRRVRCYNRWAFTYIGMYGYSFSKGGEKAIQLFETREWMDIVKDNLIQNVLLMASIVIGGLTGIFTVLVEEMDGYTFTSLQQPVLISFWIGAILGFVLSNILLLGVVGSAVNTVLVCFAADPFEFDKNHPVLSREMREVWSQQVWEPSVENIV